MEYENSPLGLPRSVFKVCFLLKLGNTKNSMVPNEQSSEMDKNKIWKKLGALQNQSVLIGQGDLQKVYLSI